MRATFFGFEAIRKALAASQTALDVTGQNVSNANTPGYTRQRLDVSSISPDSGAVRYATTSAAVGQGVDIKSITQIRDQFLDLRYREESAGFGKWSANLSIIKDVENVLDEVSTNGLNKRLEDFYNQLQSFSLNAESIEFASVFRSSAQKVAEVLNQYSRQLSVLKEQYIFNTGNTVNDVNQELEKIAELNSLIKGEIVQGNTPNELMDMRNTLLDKLSEQMGTDFEFKTDGQVSVKLQGAYLLDSSKGNLIKKLNFQSAGYPAYVEFADGTAANIKTGSIGGYLTGLNGKGTFASSPSEDNSIGIEFFQKSIDSLAQVFADNFNTLNDATGVKKLFVVGDGSGIITAGNIKLSDEWMADAQFITRSETMSGEGSNDTLMKMIESMDTKRAVTPNFNGTFEEFVVSMMGDMAVQVKYSQDMKDTSESVLNTVSDQRESVMGVSLDEETMNMEKYQKSYNAAARLMTVMDEMLDQLINRTGIAGR